MPRNTPKKLRANNIEKYREINRNSYRKNFSENCESRKNYLKRWCELNPEKHRAHALLAYYVKQGKIIKPELCERCSQQLKLHAHHKDYSKPLEVVWLCCPCHNQQHLEAI